MTGLFVRVWYFGRNDSAATAIEYGLIAALVAVGAIAAFMLFGDNLTLLFNAVEQRSTAAMQGAF